MIPLGWIAWYDNGAGGEDIFTSRATRWEDLSATNCLAVRVFYVDKVRTGLHHYSDKFNGRDFVWRVDRAGTFEWKQSNTRPTGVAANLVKEGVLIPDERWASLASTFNRQEDAEEAAWR